jgi:hypothetical protein
MHLHQPNGEWSSRPQSLHLGEFVVNRCCPKCLTDPAVRGRFGRPLSPNPGQKRGRGGLEPLTPCASCRRSQFQRYPRLFCISHLAALTGSDRSRWFMFAGVADKLASSLPPPSDRVRLSAPAGGRSWQALTARSLRRTTTGPRPAHPWRLLRHVGVQVGRVTRNPVGG